MPPRLVTLTTDFGDRDAYVAAMKGVIISIAGQVPIVDISHAISPQDVMEAAFVLRSAMPYFPSDAIHVVVVDPGVGTERKAIAVAQGGRYFVGPDNGLFSLALDEVPDEIVELDRSEWWRTSDPSATFHGRDIFSPVAAYLVSGYTLGEVGTHVDDLTTLHWALPISDNEGVQGWIVHVDHFGNCVTNISRDIISSTRSGRAVKCYVGNTAVDGIYPTYGSVAAGEPLALFNSIDHLEIAVNGGNASELLNLRKGSTVNLLFQSRR